MTWNLRHLQSQQPLSALSALALSAAPAATPPALGAVADLVLAELEAQAATSVPPAWREVYAELGLWTPQDVDWQRRLLTRGVSTEDIPEPSSHLPRHE